MFPFVLRQGNAAHNLSLSGVSNLTGLDRLELSQLFLRSHARQAIGPTLTPSEDNGGTLVVMTSEGEVREAGEMFAVEPGTGTLLVQRIGSHTVTGDVDFERHRLENAVLESPDIRYAPVICFISWLMLGVLLFGGMRRGEEKGTYGSNDENGKLMHYCYLQGGGRISHRFRFGRGHDFTVAGPVNWIAGV